MAQGLPLSARLGLLVAGTTLPLILFATGLVYHDYMAERAAASDRVLENVRSIQIAMDAEMRAVTAALEVLAGSTALRRNDMDGFGANVAVFLRRYPPEAAVSLARRDGTQDFNSRLPPKEPLPKRITLDNIETVFRTGKPAYSNVFFAPIVKMPIVVVSVPVFENENVIYELGFNPPLAAFQTLIERPWPSEDWTVAIFDRNGTNFARVPNPQQTLGQQASPSLLPVLLEQREGKLMTTSLEGVPLLTAFTRSPVTGWTVAAGIPLASVTGPLWHALAVTLSIGFVMFTIGLAFAIGMARQIAHGEQVQRLLLAELNHRVKNALAIVQSVAAQTFRETSDPNEARKKFDSRLIAIGRTHALLSDEQWASAFVHDIVQNVFKPHLSDGDARLHISGPPIRVEAHCAMMLSLALHELATNAAKYGALSTATGHIMVEWQRADAERQTVRLTWTESGGPPVRQTEHRGFGSRLIEEAFPRQFQSRVELALNPTGVCCTLEFPAA